MKYVPIYFFIFFIITFSSENIDYNNNEEYFELPKNFISNMDKNIEYNYNSILDYDIYNINGQQFKLNTTYLDIGTLDYNFNLDKIIIEPTGYTVKLKTKYYDLDKISFKFDINDFNWKLFDINYKQNFSFEENSFSYLRHTFKFPYNNNEFRYSFGNSSTENYIFHGIVYPFQIDIIAENSSINSNELYFKYQNDIFIGISNYSAEGDMKAKYINGDEHYNAGDINGDLNNYYIGKNNYKFSYSKLNVDTFTYIDKDNLSFIVNNVKQGVWLKLKADMEIFNFEHSFTKEFNYSTLKILSNFGIINNHEFYFLKSKKYYTYISSDEITKTKYEKKSIEEDYIYYALFSLNYEKYWNSLTIGINKLIPLLSNPNFKSSEYTVYSNSSSSSILAASTASSSSDSSIASSNDDDSSNKNEIIKSALLSGLTLYFRYEF